MMRKIDHIIIHISDSPYGNGQIIDGWHRQRGWDGIGYHYVILNAYPDEASYRQKRPNSNIDGMMEMGRAIEKAGAHCKGHNAHSIGICLIGKKSITGLQLISLVRLVHTLMKKYDIPVERVFGHREFNAAKTCPDLDMDYIRKLIKQNKRQLG